MSLSPHPAPAYKDERLQEGRDIAAEPIEVLRASFTEAVEMAPADYIGPFIGLAMVDRLERAETELERFREVVERLSKRHCGIPGHAVAVGCGASYVAAKALEGTFLAWCPDCHGHGFTWDFTTGPQSKRVACETCQTTDSPPGFLRVATSLESPPPEPPKEEA